MHTAKENSENKPVDKVNQGVNNHTEQELQKNNQKVAITEASYIH